MKKYNEKTYPLDRNLVMDIQVSTDIESNVEPSIDKYSNVKNRDDDDDDDDDDYHESANPVSRLHEMCVKKAINHPKWTLIYNSTDTCSSVPVFTYEVEIIELNLKATGTENKKKKAKHTAAENMLSLIGTKTNEETFAKKNSKPSIISETFSGNYVGSLTRLCQINKWSTPVYTSSEPTGLPHCRVFICSCTVLMKHPLGKGDEIKSEGIGTSIKLSKHEAARNMRKKLIEMNPDCDDPERDITKTDDESKKESVETELERFSLSANPEEYSNDTDMANKNYFNFNTQVPNDNTATCMEIAKPFNFDDNNIFKIEKKCPLIKMYQMCYIGVYCPFDHGLNSILNQETNIIYETFHKETAITVNNVVTLNEMNDTKKKYTVILSLENNNNYNNNNNYIIWTDDLINRQYKVNGKEATMIYFVEDPSNPEYNDLNLNQLKKNNKKAHFKRLQKLRQYENERQENTKKIISYDKTPNVNLHCPEECGIREYNTSKAFAYHYITKHEYPVIYYDQPIRLQFLSRDTLNQQLNTNKFLWRYIIKFGYEINRYFLIEYWDDDIHCNITMYDFTDEPKSNYAYELKHIQPDVGEYNKKISTIHEYVKNKNKPIVSLHTKSMQYILHIKPINNLKYMKEELIIKKGCHICFNKHQEKDCEFNYILNENNNSFIKLTQEEKTKRIEKFHEKQLLLKIEKQNGNMDNYEYNPIAYLYPTELKFSYDITAKTVHEKLYKKYMELEQYAKASELMEKKIILNKRRLEELKGDDNDPNKYSRDDIHLIKRQCKESSYNNDNNNDDYEEVIMSIG